MALDFSPYVRSESDRFAAALRRADPSARVPSCPEWTAADLLYHLTEVHDFWTQIVSRTITDDDEIEALEAAKPARPDDYAELLELYARGTDALLDALATADNNDQVWTWASDRSVGFVRRFQAHEALMHRVDAELAAGGDLTPLPAELADDGIDVVLRFQKTWRPGWAEWDPSGPVGRIHATDTDRRWTLRLGSWSGHSPDTGKTYDAQDAIELVADDGQTGVEPGFIVHGSAADLDAWLWNRPGFGDVTIDGAADRFVTLVSAGVQ